MLLHECARRHHPLRCGRSAAWLGVLQDSQISAVLPTHAAKMSSDDTCGAASCLCCCRRPLLLADALLLPSPAARVASMASISAARGLWRFRLLAGLAWQAQNHNESSAAGRSSPELLAVSAGCAPASAAASWWQSPYNCNTSSCKAFHPSDSCQPRHDKKMACWRQSTMHP